MIKEKYETAEIELIRFITDDILLASPVREDQEELPFVPADPNS